MWKNALVAACLFGVTANAQVVALSTPPRLQGGARRHCRRSRSEAAQVLVELSIDPSGEVTKITPLRATPRLHRVR